MSINDIEKLNSAKIESLNKKNSREISRLEDQHVLHKSEIKRAHESEIVDLQHQNLNQLATETEKKEKILSQMKHHLDMTKKMTDQEIRDLKQKTYTEKQKENEKVITDRDRIRSEQDLFLNDVNYRFTNEHKDLVNKHNTNLETLKQAKGQEYADKDAELAQKLSKQSEDFTTRFNTDARTYKEMRETQDKQFKNERMSTNLRQQIEMDKVTTHHNKTLEVKDHEFRAGLKDQNLRFEKKYSENLGFRNAELKKLEDLNKKVESKIKGDLQQKIESKVVRSEDPFYRFTELNPTLKEFERHIEISVPIPAHSKSDVSLSLNNKEAVINFNRRYDDSRKDGSSVNKLHKVESYTTRLTTNHHLDAKSVKSSYNDGIMTYSIQKA